MKNLKIPCIEENGADGIIYRFDLSKLSMAQLNDLLIDVAVEEAKRVGEKPTAMLALAIQAAPAGW